MKTILSREPVTRCRKAESSGFELCERPSDVSGLDSKRVRVSHSTSVATPLGRWTGESIDSLSEIIQSQTTLGWDFACLQSVQDVLTVTEYPLVANGGQPI